jgi:hypothetical protein
MLRVKAKCTAQREVPIISALDTPMVSNSQVRKSVKVVSLHAIKNDRSKNHWHPDKNKIRHEAKGVSRLYILLDKSLTG